MREINKGSGRELKFRAWDGEKMFSLGPVEEFDVEGKLISRHVLMQYTGLKDKNGKEIYEGDRVLFTTIAQDGSTGMKRVYEVRWSDHTASFKPSRLTHKNKDEIEVIGNIYENPELIK